MGYSVAGFGALYGDKINLYALFAQFVSHTVPSDCEEESAAFDAGKCLDRLAMRIARSVLDLKKDGFTVFFRDDIDLSALGRDIIGRHDLVFVSLEVGERDHLALVSDFAIGFGHKQRVKS